MRPNLCFVFLICLTVARLYAQSSLDLLHDGNELYAQGRYQDALEKYETVIKTGFESGELYYNMGNSCYKLQQIGKAILYYERAAKYLAGDEALEKNLAIARLVSIDKIEPIPRLRLTIWKDELLNFLSVNFLAWSTFFSFVLLCGIIAANILLTRKLLRRAGGIAGILFIFILLLFSAKIYQAETNQYAI